MLFMHCVLYIRIGFFAPLGDMSPTEDMCFSVVHNHPLGSLHHVKAEAGSFEECELIMYIVFHKVLGAW